jgi:hypothetical protein
MDRKRLTRKDTHKYLGCDPCPPGDLYLEVFCLTSASK